MAEVLRPDLCVLGGGAGGIAAAYAAATAGASVIVVEHRHFTEGYPNPGLVMHVIIEAGRAVVARRTDSLFGPPPRDVIVDKAPLRVRVQKLTALALDSPTRLAAMNIDLIRGKGRFVNRKRLETADAAIEAKWFILAPGTTPALMPEIKGLEFVRALQPEALLERESWPDLLIMIGGSAHGLALAQALSRLGTKVHLFEAGKFLPHEDRELVAPMLNRLRRDGVVLYEDTIVERVEPDVAGFYVEARVRGAAFRLKASHLMLTAEPVPLIEGLGLAEAQVAYDKSGIKVRADLRSISNPRIYAIGDVLGGPQSYANTRSQAYGVIAHIFDGEKRPPVAVPRVVFSDPQMAAVGLTEAEAHEHHRKIRILRASFHDNVAAQIAGEAEGHVKIVTDSDGRLLGAALIAPQARELISLFGLALGRRLHAKDLRSFVPASPSLAETVRLAALAAPTKFGTAFWQRIFPVARRFY